MARETRKQRRAQQRTAGAGAPASSRAAQPQVRPSALPSKQQTGKKESKGKTSFIRESWGELKKVDWPTRQQTFQGVVVVLIAVAIVGAYLWALDQIIRPFVKQIL